MVSITISGNAHEVRTEMAGLLGAGQAPLATSGFIAPATDKATKEKKEKPAETAAPAQAPAEAKAPLQDATAQVAYADTLDGVTGVITAIASKESLGKPAAVKLLAEFGVKRGKEVPPEKFAEFVKKGIALLA